MPELMLAGARIFYERAGAGQPLVFLHGVGSSSHTWAGQLQAFAAAGWLCVAPDMRGYARSSCDDPTTISIARFGADVGALIEQLGTGAAHVCGLSMGAIVALHLWREQPGLVRSLVLCDAWANHPQAAAGQADRLRAIDAATMRQLAQVRMQGVYGPSAAPELVRRGVDVFGSLDKAAYREASADLWTQDVRAVAATVAVPTLVVVGEQDQITPLRLSEELAAIIPAARLAVIPAAGHLTNEENPRGFNSVVGRFLGGLQPEFRN